MKRVVLSLAILLALLSGATAQWNGCKAGFCNTQKVSSGHAMITPIMVSAGGVGPSATAINYISWADGQLGTSIFRDAPNSISGTISGLTVLLPTSVASNAYVFTLFKNGSATALTCAIASGTTCTDSSHSVSIVPGDTLMWQTCPTSTSPTCSVATATTQATMSLSAVLTSTANGESEVILSKAVAPSASIANYNLFGTVPTGGMWNATEANISGIVPTSGVLDQLQVNAAAPGAGKTVVWTVWKNGAFTNISCTLAGSGSGAGITFCADTSNSISVAAGDTISLQSCPGTVSAGSCTPALTPTTGNTGASLRWVPTVPGESISMNTVVSFLSTSGPRFTAVNDIVASSTEITFSLVPTLFVLKKFYVALDAAPGAGTPSRTWVNRFGTGGGQSSGSLTVTLTTSATGSDLANSYSASVNDLLGFMETPASTPAVNTFYKQSYVLATP